VPLPEEPVAIILAAGVGSRVGGRAPKQFLDLNGAPVLARTVANLAWCPRVLIVHHPEHLERTSSVVRQVRLHQRVMFVPGGLTRRGSISAALAAIPHLSDEVPVILQNAASPNTPTGLVKQCLEALESHEVVQAYLSATHTILRHENGEVSEILQRSTLAYSVDPTVYRLGSLRRIAAAQTSQVAEGEMTLDTARALGIAVHLVKSPDSNVKLTTMNDLVVLRALVPSEVGDSLDH
jgi:2-C-methyl-D-erythritol 4-phosphate cytidylyltransferase